MGSNGMPWLGGAPSAAPPPPSNDGDDFGLQFRPMGLKVHYTFDKEGQVHCLARWPQILQIQTIPLDERNTIGVVDLRLCLQAIAQCSPEIVGQQEQDYAIYAFDYSEPDTPLVGQGMLSWGLDPANANPDPQARRLITGRVTKNLLAIFGNGIRETLEVKLKLTGVAKVQRAEMAPSFETQQSSMKSAPTPTDTSSEWTSFLQSNPTLGRSANVSSISSPALASARPEIPANPVLMPRNSPAPLPPPPNQRPLAPAPPAQGPAPDEAPLAAGPAAAPVEAAPKKPARPSRPSSRASRKEPTGRPRGRPRKKPLNDGNTSAIEDATDADEGPKKKRAKITKADYPDKTPLDAAPDSLRVAASISGSLRTMRPIMAAGSEGHMAGHLQEGPRAPTPVPNSLALGQKPRKGVSKSRRESLAEFDGGSTDQPMFEASMLVPQNQDARSPTESAAGQSPFQGYTPEDSPADIGSSPPVPRSVQFMRSSPIPSSPILPPMPLPQPDSGFMSGGIDDLFEEEELPQTFPQPIQEELPVVKPRARKPANRKPFHAPGTLSFQQVHPGPPELLPVNSIFNPHGKTLLLNKPAQPAEKAVPELQRANTEPTLPLSAPPEEVSTATPDVTPAVEPDLPQLPRPKSANNAATLIPAAPDVPDEVTEEPTLPTLPALPAQEEPAKLDDDPKPAPTKFPTLPQPTKPSAPRQMARAASMGSAPLPTIPASDPVPMPSLTLPQTSFSEAPCPPSDAIQQSRSNKNLVKKQSIKERLEKAIESGEMPPFCNNCGAIETPTWRKMWTQDHDGIPQFVEFSEKPGHVTAIDILERDADGKPTRYRLVKKALGLMEDKHRWTELLLCNPCGIWLSKFKCHRPADRWEKDQSRLNQPRKKRESKSGNSRSKRARTQSEPQINPTSEAYFTTDPLGPGDDDVSPNDPTESGEQQRDSTESLSRGNTQPPNIQNDSRGDGADQRRSGSTHSRGSGTADSPIALEDDLGTTRRLLFPSPRKDGVPKVLGELAVNIVRTAPDFVEPKKPTSEKENVEKLATIPRTPRLGVEEMEDLFGTPPATARPSTPPPNEKSGNSGSFKTPTRPTPNHRPITRSISKSIRSARSIPMSPSQAILQLQQTPTKTPRNAGGQLTASATRRRTPRTGPQQHLHAHFAVEEHEHHGLSAHFDTPFTATLNQLLSEANDFTSGSPAHGLADLDLGALPGLSNIDSDGLPHLDGVHNHLATTGALDFGNFLSTDMAMPSSPPLLGGAGRNRAGGGHVSFGAALTAYESTGASFWASFGDSVLGDEEVDQQHQIAEAS